MCTVSKGAARLLIVARFMPCMRAPAHTHVQVVGPPACPRVLPGGAPPSRGLHVCPGALPAGCPARAAAHHAQPAQPAPTEARRPGTAAERVQPGGAAQTVSHAVGWPGGAVQTVSHAVGWPGGQ